ncbi:helix-turn-helix transcriptional regulator [Alcanivoracaceae bacterium MT1]
MANIMEPEEAGVFHRFATSDVEESEKLDALREYLKGVDSVKNFHFSKEGALPDLEDRGVSTDRLMVGTRKVTGAMTRKRTSSDLRRSSLDVVLFCVLEQGEVITNNRINVGEVYLMDTRREYDVRTQHGFVTKNIIVPADQLDIPESEIKRWHEQPIKGGVASFLADYIRMINGEVDRLSCLPEDAIVMTQSILKAVLSPSANTYEEARQQLDKLKLLRIKRYIDKQIMSRYLSVDELCAYAGMSRRSLQRLFEEEETSVVAYIAQEKLRRARQDLFLGKERKISAVAEKYGFSSSAYFCACFKKMYDCLPRDVLSLSEGGTLGRGLSKVPILARTSVG